jgi:tetratricopeptide (TPR) repeat protein
MYKKKHLHGWVVALCLVMIFAGCSGRKKSAELFAEASNAMLNGNLEKALQLSEESLKYDRKNINALKFSSEIYEIFGKFDEAAANWLKLEEMKAIQESKIKFRLRMLYTKKMLIEKYYNSAILANRYKQYDNSLAFCDSIFLVAPRETKASLLCSQLRQMRNNDLVKKYIEQAQAKERLRLESYGLVVGERKDASRDDRRAHYEKRDFNENGLKYTMVYKIPKVEGSSERPLSMAGLMSKAVYESSNFSEFKTALSNNPYVTERQREGFNRIFDKWEVKEGADQEPSETQISGVMWDLFTYDAAQEEGKVEW